MNTFKELNIIEPILKAVDSAGYDIPTPIQVEAIPALLDKKDILGSAQTGTGKTAAFAIPILQQIYLSKTADKKRLIEALILTPTRELASQIGDSFTLYAKHLNIRNTVVFGGVSQKRQETALLSGVNILIATPGRLLDLMNQGIISLEYVKYLVLDEADQMLDMGFIKDVQRIISKVPKVRQTMLFSATMPKQIEELSKSILKDPVRIAVVPVTKTLDVIDQKLYHVNKKQKTDLLIHLIKTDKMRSVLVFTRTKHQANRVVKSLTQEKLLAEAIHGDKSQAARERALANFKKGSTHILVATDIAARGIDIEALSFVVNYDLPEVPETYIHRIGRTGRAGLGGQAISFCDILEKKLFSDIEKHTQKKLQVIEDHPYKPDEAMALVQEIVKPLSQIARSKKQFSSKTYDKLHPSRNRKDKKKVQYRRQDSNR